MADQPRRSSRRRWPSCASARLPPAPIRLLNQLASRFKFQQPDSSRQYASLALELARRVADSTGVFEGYSTLSITYGWRGNNEASLPLFPAQLRLADQVPRMRKRRPAVAEAGRKGERVGYGKCQQAEDYPDPPMF